MSYIFIDESGDLGNKKSSSKYFVIAAIKVTDSKKLERIINKIRTKEKDKIGHSNEIKGSIIPSEIIIKIFNRLNKIDYETYIVIFDKKFRYKIKDGYNNNNLYDVIAGELAKLISIDSSTLIYIDKSKNKKEEIEKFNKEFLNNLENNKKYKIKINHVDSTNFKGLQITDLISWSTFQCVENKNQDFIKLIKNKCIKIVFKD